MNSRKIFFFITILVTIQWTAVAEKKTRLFILSGQSNMGVLKYKKNFVPYLNKKFPNDELIVAYHAKSGQSMGMWIKAKGKKGKHYQILKTNIEKAIEGKKFDSATFIWMQGEADARSKDVSTYEERLYELVDSLKKEIKRSSMFVIIGRLSDYGLNEKARPSWNKIREIQERFATKNKHAELVNTDDLNGDKNELHYTANGYETLGKRFVDTALKQIKSK